MIPVWENHPRIVVTDGYHFTRPLKLVYKDLDIYCFKVVCAISDQQLVAGGMIIAASYLGGFYTDLMPLKVFSFLPILYFVFFYYMNRKEFIRLVPVVN